MDDEVVDGSLNSGAVGTGNDARLALLAEINDRNDREGAEELADVNDDGTTSAFLVEGEKKEPEVTEVEPEVIEPEPVAKAPEPEIQAPKFKIKVNGKEIELTQEELIARAQKVESADAYLADAARAKRASEAPPPPEGPTAEEIQRQQDEEDARIVRAIQMGTEEEAKIAVRLLTSRVAARPSVSPDDMSRAIDERLAFNEAITDFRKNFPDIASEPLLNSLAQQRDANLVASGDTRPYKERYESIGKELRAWKEGLVPAPNAQGDPKVPDVSFADKDAKKAAAPKTPAIATKKVAKVEEEDEDGEEDTATVIANIRKARGGPQWMRN
jgi:hypothetical protein